MGKLEHAFIFRTCYSNSIENSSEEQYDFGFSIASSSDNNSDQ